MRFINLRFALAQVRMPHFELAQLLRVSESALSRKLTGRREFTVEERARIAEILSARGATLDASWLFSEPVPPRAKREENNGVPAVGR